jgi:hypothetical protein
MGLYRRRQQQKHSLPSTLTSPFGTKLPIRDVCYSVATRGKPDIGRQVQFGPD